MGSCSKNGEGEMNGTVGGGVEVNSCSEIEKEIEVVGDPTDDIMIDGIMAGGDNLMISDEGLFTSLAEYHYLSSPAPSSASITLPQDLSSSSSSSSSSTYPWAYIDVPGPSKEAHMMQQQGQGQDQLDQMMVPSAEAAAEDILAGFDLWDASNPLDPSFLFADDYDTALETPLQKCDQAIAGNGDDNSSGNEMGRIFYDWLRNNRGKISMEDLRSIKLKRSTIDSAAARLGPGDEGRKDLLRLILAWVQNSHLKKRRVEAQDPPPESVLQLNNNYQPAQQQQQQQQQVVPSLTALAYNSPQYQFQALLDAAANPNSNLDYNNCEGGWNMYYGSMENPMLPVPALQSMMVSAGEAASMNPYHPYYQSGSTGNIVVNSQPLSPSPDFHSFSPAPPIQHPQFPGLGIPLPHPILQYTRGFGSQYPVYLSPHLTGVALATKEARMKRMARQRRYSVLNQHKNQNHSQHSSLNAATVGQNANLSPRTEGGGSSSMTNIYRSNNVNNLAFWASCRQRNLPTNAATAGSAPPLPAKTSNMQQSLLQQRNRASSDMLQPSKKNMRFVLQKVLKQSDVGSLGRIVLPKKEAELHLPELDSRDGMTIPMEDIGTSQVWNMKYRFWPNNKSRMYLLENAGDFVRSNGLQEGDFIVIYFDVKRNKYMIRGVKVRQPAEPIEVAAVGVGLNGAGTHLNNSSDHLNSTSRTAAVCDLENNENNEGEGLLSFSEDDGGASPSMIMGDDI